MTNFYFNLTEKLQGCSKQKGMVVCTSNPDGQPTVNRQSRLMLRQGKRSENGEKSSTCLRSASDLPPFCLRYLRYAAMIFAVLVMSMANIGMAWGDTYTDTYTNPKSGPLGDGKGYFTLITLGDGFAFNNSSVNISSNGGTGTFTISTIDGSYIDSINFALNSDHPASAFSSTDGTVTKKSETEYGFKPSTTTKTSVTFSVTGASGKKPRIAPIRVLVKNREYFTKNFSVSSGTVSCVKSNASTDIVMNTTGSVSSYNLQLNSKSLTITSSGHNIKKIYFVGQNQGSISLSANTGTYSSNAWTAGADVNTVTFTSSSNVYIAAISVELESASSDSYDIHIGKDNDNYTDESLTNTSGTTWSKTITLDAGSYYEFKVKKTPSAGDAVWYGNNGAIVTDIDWNFPTSGGNAKLYTGPAGDYVFTFNTSTGNVTITYPDVEHPCANYVYFVKPNDWNAVRIYNYTSDSYRMSDWDGSPTTTKTATICGNTYYYCAASTKFDNVIWRDNNSHQSTNLSTSGGLGKYFDFSVSTSAWQSFTSYTISFAGNGNTGGTMSAITGICPNSNQAITANAFEKTGHTFNCWHADVATKVGGSAVAIGGDIAGGATLQEINNNITLTAQWSPEQYDVTLEKGSAPAAGESGSAKVLYNGTELTNITHATWTGHVLTGYYTSNSGGTKVLNANGSFAASTVGEYITDGKWIKAENTTLKAQWTAKTTTITINANTDNNGSTAPSPITATYGSALPSFTAATGTSGYSLIGYFTAATSGTKIINADGSLVRNTTYSTDESTPKWKSEAATLTLFAQYEEEVVSPSKCITFNDALATHVTASGTTYDGVTYTYSLKSDISTSDGANLAENANYLHLDIASLGTINKVVVTIKSIGTENNDSKGIKYGFGASDMTLSLTRCNFASGAELELTPASGTPTGFKVQRNGTSIKIEEICIYYTPAACSTPAAPTALTCSAQTSSSLTFTWTKASNASTYTAKLYSDSGCESQVASQDLGDVATVTFSTLSASTTYYCKVQSHGDGSTYCAAGGTTSAASGTTSAAAITGSTSVNIEQGVLTNSKNWSYTSALTSANITYDLSSGCELDSLNDGCSKTDRNNNYLGLKIKSNGKYIQVTLPADKTLKVRFGYRAAVVKVWIDEVVQTDIPTTGDYYTYELASSGSNRTVKIATSSDGAVVIKQIMIGEAIASVTLPAMITLGSTTNGTISVASTKVNVGSTVTVTATPSSGYELATLTYKKDCPADFTPVDIKDAEEFTMPNGNVTINATFAASCTAPTTAFANGSYTIGGSALDLSTLISSNNSSGAITYTVKTANGTGATIAGTSFSATVAGTATVTATQAADATYCEKVMDATITVSAPAATLYTVTYAYNGATGGNGTASVMQASEDAPVTLASPTRTGFEFDGWYKTDGTKVSSPSYTPTADITLYARWQEACDAEGVAKSTTDVAATGYTAYQEKGGSNVVFTAAPSLGFKYKDAADNTINNSTTATTRNNAYSCQIKSDSGNKGSIKTNSTFSNVDSISFYFAASDKGGCKIAVWYSTDNFSTDSTSLLSATTYAGSNSEFKLKTLAIPAAKKTSALTFKFRFTVTGAGKTCYMDSLKVYSSTSGGGTCYHVYYHGNGAESGYVNDTLSYTAGSKATVLNYNYGRNPLAKTGYDFRGWATSASGAVAYSAGQKIDITSADVDLYAVWATASTALVTWTMNLNTSTWGAASTSTTDETNISSIGTARTGGSDGKREGATAKVSMAEKEVSSAAAPSNSANFTFTIAGGKQVEINKFDCKVFNVASGSRTYKAQISDGAGNVYNSTNTVAVSAEATLTDASFVFGSGKILRGDVTIRIYAWGSGSEFRMGPDVKFYGTVEDYTCATPAAPTISGVSEYVPGQTITLTASHDGENYDNLTTYTWYKGVDWATASGTTPVQAAATGESGYTLTIAATGNAGLYWCEAANGTCKAHNAAGYDVTVFPAYTITWHLNDGTWGEVEHKDSYTQFDEDYTLPVPTKADAIFAGWYGASDFSGLPTVVLGAGSVGDKEYWAKWGETVTVSWTVTKVDDELYRGGGGYSVKAVINETTWNESYKDQLELTATEGVTLKNIVASVNGESKVQVTADFDITTGLAADATSITFTLNVPADGTYGPKVDEHEEDLTSCAGSSTVWNFAYASDDRPTLTSSNAGTEGNKNTLSATTGSGNLYYFAGSSDAFETDKYLKMNGASSGGSVNNRSVYQNRCFYIDITSNGTLTIQQYADNGNGAPKYVVANTRPLQSDYPSSSVAPTTTGGATYEINVTNYSSGTADRIWVAYPTAKAYIISVTWTPTGGGGTVTPTLTWTPALNTDADWDSGNNRLNKETGDPDFTFVANQNKNSLGAITYESSDPAVATVNAAGTVHIVGAAGDATITATLAASGCFEEATATYNIHVEDNCIDEPGTITATDLGCDGIQMTVSGHTGEGAGATYQWYKDDAVVSGATEITYTATAAGEYYVMVTNTGTDHCAMASTNTIKVTAKAAATATKIVDSWYVKKDRRTPDVELVKTTGATGFTVKIGSTVIWNSDGSIITGFAGCGFRMDENGIIYLNGTKDGASGTSDNADAPAHGDETWTAGDVTLTITAIGCGSSASQNITIHKQAATTYKEIAFVADGGKGMRKDSITVGHGDGTELYEYLDSVGTAAENRLFKLSERNIYWTTDEKAIREEYSQFDAILITDDPSTNTVVKNGDDYKTKGYVNAFGTMVDVRPIFTMEAYVSALKNWGSKGIAGNPQSPNPRQYEMRLECKDHEIYGAGLPDPEDGTNVWEEVIDGETFRHVILVDSTLGIYNGVKYNQETAGDKKPALQGFTGEAAGSLLGLGRILEGTLQAAIERQEEPAARLLVMGINAKALQPTCALTNEGKAVIKNILTYLLKTNMEEVDDCSNYFTGKIDNDWSKAGNWSKKSLPSSEAKVRILAPCVISGIQPHVLQVSIVNSGNSNIRNTARGSAVCDGTLTIEPDGALIADGKIRSAVAPHFAANDLMPTTPEMLTINTGSDAQAALIFNNEEGLTKATVNLHSLGRNDGSYKYQYFAIPMEYVSVSPAFANETHGGTKIYTYVYNEASSGWTRRGYYDDLYAFEGLGITTKSTVAMNYTMTGTLASTATKEITLTHDGAGLNLIGNSWMAPIQIGALAEDNTDANITQTVYIYSAGRDAVGGALSGETETAGQWIAIPFEAADFATWKATGKLSVIPAMQAFQIKTAAEATLTLDYDKVVRGSTNDLNAKLRAPRRRVAAKEVTMTNIRVSDSKTHTDLSLFEGERFSDEFDNGWEAEYMNGDGRSAKLYAETVDGKMAVVAMTDYEGTMVGFAPGQERVYIFSFMGADNGYYLNDIKMQQSVRVSEGETYSFTYEDGDDASRFMISRTPFEKPGVATGTENIDASVPQARKILYNDKLYIIRGGHMYDATGKMVK